VLGALQVLDAGAAPIELRSASQRRLVCFLLIRGAEVSGDVTAEYLKVTPGALRTTVSCPRRILGFSTLVTSTPPGYQLRADEVDARQFEYCLAEAVASGNATEARQLLETPIWTVTPNAGFNGATWSNTTCLDGTNSDN